MGSFAELLLTRHDELVQRWYEAWRKSRHPHPEVAEAALKNSLASQLVLIGEQLRDLGSAEQPHGMWKVSERLEPEKRISEDIPIEEVVQEYRLVVDTVRDRVEESRIEVPFHEYSYFYDAIFELTAESVRRYARRQADLVRAARGEYLAALMHQLRTPLSTLTMAVDVLGRGGSRSAARFSRQPGAERRQVHPRRFRHRRGRTAAGRHHLPRARLRPRHLEAQTGESVSRGPARQRRRRGHRAPDRAARGLGDERHDRRRESARPGLHILAPLTARGRAQERG